MGEAFASDPEAAIAVTALLHPCPAGPWRESRPPMSFILKTHFLLDILRPASLAASLMRSCNLGISGRGRMIATWFDDLLEFTRDLDFANPTPLRPIRRPACPWSCLALSRISLDLGLLNIGGQRSQRGLGDRCRMVDGVRKEANAVDTGRYRMVIAQSICRMGSPFRAASVLGFAFLAPARPAEDGGIGGLAKEVGDGPSSI